MAKTAKTIEVDQDVMSTVRTDRAKHGVWFGGHFYYATDEQLEYINTPGVKEPEIMEYYGLVENPRRAQ